MTEMDLSSVLRKICMYIFTLWASIIFQGIALGSLMMFFANLFEPYLKNNFELTVNATIPEWLYFAAGTGLMVFYNLLKGKPILRDGNREQFEAIDYIVHKLPELDRVHVYRSIAYKIIDKFDIDSDYIDLKEEANKSVEEEKGPSI